MGQRRPLPRTGQGYHKRPVGFRQPLPRFLIVCEGERTEINYLRRFRQDYRIPIELVPDGGSPMQVVDRARRLSLEGDYDQVWCVFDRDAWSAQEFNGAIVAIVSRGFRVAYSNEAFELWYLLHFDFCDTAIARQDYIAKLSQRLGYPYIKNSQATYDALVDRQPQAIRNAERLLAEYDPPRPVTDNPSTTVHLLVKELNRFAR